MRNEDLRYRENARNAIPSQVAFQGANSKDFTSINTRQTRQVQAGNEYHKSVVRIGGLLDEPNPDLFMGYNLFFFDPDHPVNTYYYDPEARKNDPTRDAPPGCDDNNFQLTESTGTGDDVSYKKNISPALDTVCRVMPEFMFNQDDNYSMTCKIELLNASNVTVNTFIYSANVTQNPPDYTSTTFTNTAPIDIDIMQNVLYDIYGIKVSWTSGCPDARTGTCAINWLCPQPISTKGFDPFPVEIDVSPYYSTYEIDYTFSDLPDNIIEKGNEDWETEIQWANPDDHNELFPWHYQGYVYQPISFLNYRSFSELFDAGGPFASQVFLNVNMITVDADGADVDTIGFGFGEGTGGLGLLKLTGSAQTKRANGFKLKVTQRAYAGATDYVYPTESNIVDLFKPFKIFWTNAGLIPLPPP